MKKFLEFFSRKGVLATLIGLAIAVPVDLIAIKAFYNKTDLSEPQLMAIVILNIIAMAWVILPSKIIISSKLLNVTIED